MGYQDPNKKQLLVSAVSFSEDYSVESNDGPMYNELHAIGPLIEFLQEAVKEGATHVDFGGSQSEGGYEGSHSVSSVQITTQAVRVETDEEFKTRKEQEQAKAQKEQELAQARREQSDKEQYERLKKKFEGSGS